MNPTDVLRATYALEFKSIGLAEATRADQTFRKNVADSAKAVTAGADATKRAQAEVSTAWKRTAEIATKAQNDIAKVTRTVSAEITGASDKTVASLRKQGAAYDAIAVQMKRMGADAEAVAASIEKSAAREAAAMAKVEAQQRKMAEMGSMGYRGSRIQSAGGRIAGAGSTAAMAALPVAAVGYEAIKSATDYQKQLALLQTQANSTAKQVAELNGQMLRLGTTMGYSGSTMATAMYHIASEGYHGADAMKILTAASKGARTGNADLEATTNALVHTMKDLHMPVARAQEVMGGLHKIVGVGNMRMEDLVQVIGRLLPSAQNFGLGLRPVGAALATMTRLGYNAQIATNGLRMTFAMIAAPSSKAASIFKDIGLNQGQLAMDMRGPNGLVVALRDLHTHLDETAKRLGLTGKQMQVFEATALSKAFGGGRSSAAILALSQNTQDLTSNLNTLGKTTGWAGALQNAFKTTQQTAAMRTAQMKAAIQNSLISLGQTLIPIVLPPLTKMATALASAFQWFSKLPAPVKTAAIGIVALGVALGPVLFIVGNLMKAGGGLMRILSKVLPSSLGGQVRDLTKNFTTQQVATADLAATMNELAAANMRVAESYQAAAVAAKEGGAAQEASALASGGGVGGGGFGAALNRERKGMQEAQAVLPAVQQYGATGAIFGASGARTVSQAAGQAAREGGVTGAQIGMAGTTKVAQEAALTETSAKPGLMGRMMGGVGKYAGRAMGGAMLGMTGMAVSSMAGSMIGGSTGATVSGIGQAASMGAGIGMLAGPEGALAGAAIGGLAKGVMDLFSSPSMGQAVAQGLTKGFGNADMKTRVRRLIDDANKQASGAAGGDARAADLQSAGKTIAAQLEKGWNQYKFQSEPTMITQLKAETAKLPPYAKAAAYQSAVQFAQQLEAQGRLSKGSATKMLRQVEQAFPGFQKDLGTYGVLASGAFTKALNFKNAEANTKATVGRIAKDFPTVTAAVDSMQGDVLQKSYAAIQSLQDIQKHGSGPASKQAAADIRSLRASVSKDLDAMVTASDSAASGMAATIKKGSGQAADAAQTNFQHIQSSVTRAMAGGEVSVAAGVQLITKALNDALKAFGAAQVPTAGLSPKQALASVNQYSQAFFGGQAGTLSSGAGHRASGGRVPGPVGPDNWTLVDPTGQPAAMVGGSEILVANRHTEARVDSMLSMFGTSLGAEVAGENRPHYAATGGRIKGFATGGVVSYAGLEGLWDRAGGPRSMAPLMAAIAEAESTGNTMAHNASGASGLWQILGLPFPGDVYDPLTNARMAVAKYRTQGLRAWTTYTSGAYRQFLHGNVPANLAGAMAAGAGPATLSSPKVSGKGTLANLTNAGLQKVTDAANQMLAAQAGASGGGGAGGPAGTMVAPAGSKPATVEQAMFAAANHILGTPYIWGGGHGGWQAPGYDCSGAVSYVLHAGGFLGSPEATGALASWGDPGPGKYITVGVTNGGPGGGHTMMNMFGRYFESGGGPLGPHWDHGWSQGFQQYRHPRGFALGGRVGGVGAGEFGNVPPSVLLKGAPQLAGDNSFKQYESLWNRSHGGRKLARGGRLRGFATGGNLAGALGTLNSRSSSGRASVPHEYLNPFTGTYQSMTSATHRTLDDQYVQKYGHPYRKTAAHKPAAVHEHPDPFTGKYEMMTAAQASALRDSYIQKYGHPPPRLGSSGGAVRAHWDPFTGQYELLSSSEYQAQIYLPYFNRYHRPPPTRPSSARTPTSKSTKSSIAAGTATALPTGDGSAFDLGYQYGLDPTQTSATSWSDIVAAALAGMSSAGSALYGGARGIRVRRTPGGYLHVSPTHNVSGIHRPGVHHPGSTRTIGTHGTPHAPGYHGKITGGIHDTAGGLYAPVDAWTSDPTMGYSSGWETGAYASAAGMPGLVLAGLAGYGGSTVADVGAVEATSAGASHGWTQGNIVGSRTTRGARRTTSGDISAIRRGGSASRIASATSQLAAEISNVSDVSYSTLTAMASTIAKEAKKAPKGSAASKRLQQALSLVQAQEGKRTGALVAQAEGQANQLQTSATQLQRLMQRQGISSSSAQGASMTASFDQHAVQVLGGTVGQLRQALGMAKKAKDKTAIADISGKLTQALDQLDQATTDAVQARYDAITATAQQVIDNTSQGESSVQAQQTIAGTQGTQAAQQQLAGYIQGNVIPALQGSLANLQGQLVSAMQHGDSGLVATLTTSINNTTQALATATADARSAIEGAAQAAVDQAGLGTTAAQSGEQRLSLQQQLAGTQGTPGSAAAMSNYITGTLIPALNGELTALQGQQSAAQSVGDTVLAGQIADAIASKQNDILQAQLDAQTAIKDAAQQTALNTSSYGGQLGVSFGGQIFPDLAGMLNGV